jgi:hypothetical protein
MQKSKFLSLQKQFLKLDWQWKVTYKHWRVLSGRCLIQLEYWAICVSLARKVSNVWQSCVILYVMNSLANYVYVFQVRIQVQTLVCIHDIIPILHYIDNHNDLSKSWRSGFCGALLCIWCDYWLLDAAVCVGCLWFSTRYGSTVVLQDSLISQAETSLFVSASCISV